MNIKIREYTTEDGKASSEIWNQVVDDGVAFPQEEDLTEDYCNKLVKKYSKDSMIIGEAPLMKDLQDVTDVDLASVNYVSVIAIFIIIMLTFKSISIPIILVSVIEFAIFLNMCIPFYTGESLPFVASIVIGSIQLGATVDYAILMTSRYQKERLERK